MTGVQTCALPIFLQIPILPEWVQDLTDRTEGWVVGLQLAALSLQHKHDFEHFLSDFKGSHRYIVDYLMDEVLSGLPAPIRHFLLETSVLKRFNYSLCSFISSAPIPRDFLERLEDMNLFLVPLDENKEWYRYHHLFADCLMRQLPVNEKRHLLTRAAIWAEQNDCFTDAVDYILDAEDYSKAAATIERILKNPRSWATGDMAMLEQWLQRLPPESIHSRPSLLVMASRALYLRGKVQLAED